MEMYVVTFFFLALLSGLSHGSGVLPDNRYGALEGSVALNTTINPPDKPFLVVTWTFINATNHRTVIITSTSTNVIAPGYEDRITLFRSTASLELRNLNLNDNGEYIVSVISDGAGAMDGLTMLKILKTISGAVITPSTVQPVKEGMSINMTCDADGTISTREWMKDDQPLTPSSDVTLHDNNRLLSFSAVKRTDRGAYLCRVSNPINSDEVTSNMTVNYGPDNVTIDGPTEITVEQEFKLTCSADSVPSPSYHWIHNGIELDEYSHELKKMAELSDIGDYICRAKNDVTGKTSESGVHQLSGFSPLSGSVSMMVTSILILVGLLL